MAHALVIDDDRDHRALAEEILAREGRRVEVAVVLVAALRLGAQEVITKPFDFRQLVGSVQRAVSLR